jgi:hypothetical protein
LLHRVVTVISLMMEAVTPVVRQNRTEAYWGCTDAVFISAVRELCDYFHAAAIFVLLVTPDPFWTN